MQTSVLTFLKRFCYKNQRKYHIIDGL